MAICLLITACQKEERLEVQSSEKLKSKDGCVVLGNKIPDPYSFTYMVSAFDSMKLAGFDFPFTKISPTGYYVKVLVNNDSVKDILINDSTIV